MLRNCLAVYILHHWRIVRKYCKRPAARHESKCTRRLCSRGIYTDRAAGTLRAVSVPATADPTRPAASRGSAMLTNMDLPISFEIDAATLRAVQKYGELPECATARFAATDLRLQRVVDTVPVSTPSCRRLPPGGGTLNFLSGRAARVRTRAWTALSLWVARERAATPLFESRARSRRRRAPSPTMPPLG